MSRPISSEQKSQKQPHLFGLYPHSILIVIIVSILPTIVLLAISYFQAVALAKANLESIVKTATSKTDRLLEDADEILRRANIDLQEADRQTAVRVLQRQIYNDFRFREAGIINSEGLLVLSSLGVVDPPQTPSLAKIHFNAANPDLQVLGPGRSQLMQERSIALVLKGTGKIGSIYLLVDPAMLNSFLDMLPSIDLGSSGFIAFLTQDQRLLSAVGASPQDIFSSLQTQPAHMLQVTRTTKDGTITLVGQVSRRWALRYWFQELLISAPFTAFISGLLSYLFIRQLRLSSTLDYELKRGLARNEFEVHYQPIVELATRRCVGAEALIRWRHPQRGLVYPGLFLPIAEQTGFIIPITEWLLEKVMQDRVLLEAQFSDLYISMNLSPTQLNTGNIERLIQLLRSETHTSNIEITFEITENKLLEENGDVVQDTIARLKRCGIRFAIDDFGTGYSNIGYLQKLKVDQLKLDQMFIKGLGQDNHIVQIVDGLIDFGDRMNLTIVAEGIETECQYRYLRDRGVRYGQGWLFSRSLPYEDFVAYLQAQTPLLCGED